MSDANLVNLKETDEMNSGKYIRQEIPYISLKQVSVETKVIILEIKMKCKNTGFYYNIN